MQRTTNLVLESCEGIDRSRPLVDVVLHPRLVVVLLTPCIAVIHLVAAPLDLVFCIPQHSFHICLSTFHVESFTHNENLLIGAVLSRDRHFHVPVLLNVLHFRPIFADDVLQRPIVDFHLFVHNTWVRDFMVGVHDDAVEDLLRLLNLRGGTSQSDFILFALLDSIVWGRRNAYFDLELFFDLLDNDTSLSNDIGEVRRMNVDIVLGEIFIQDGAETFLDQLIDGIPRLLDIWALPRDREDTTSCVNACDSCLLLDHLDGSPPRPDDYPYLFLWDIDGGHGNIGSSCNFLFVL